MDLKLNVKVLEEDKDIMNMSEDDWSTCCIIFEKLVRNIKQEDDNVIIEDFDVSEKPFVKMTLDYKVDNIDDDQMVYIIDYLSGIYTENPVYLKDDMCHVEATVEVEESDTTSTLLDRFNKMVLDLEETTMEE